MLSPVRSGRFWNLPSTLHYRRIAVILTSSSSTYQAVVTRSEIRAVRKVVKQLPVEMRQQCTSSSGCMRMCMMKEETAPDARIACSLFLMGLRSFLVFRNTLLTSMCYLLAWIPPLPFLSCLRKLLASFSLLAGRRLFKLLWFIWLMYVRPLLWLLFDFNIPKWNPGFITCYTYVATEIFTPPLLYRCKSQSRSK
jgi:hypothetical protein